MALCYIGLHSQSIRHRGREIERERKKEIMQLVWPTLKIHQPGTVTDREHLSFNSLILFGIINWFFIKANSPKLFPVLIGVELELYNPTDLSEALPVSKFTIPSTDQMKFPQIFRGSYPYPHVKGFYFLDIIFFWKSTSLRTFSKVYPSKTISTFATSVLFILISFFIFRDRKKFFLQKAPFSVLQNIDPCLGLQPLKWHIHNNALTM